MPSIVIDTPRQHVEQRHEVKLQCPECLRERFVDFQDLIARGLGDKSVCRMRFTCSRCGVPASRTLIPPSKHAPR
jgi:hypothetical protein